MLRTALIQQNYTDGLINQRDKLVFNIHECARLGAELIVLQELHDHPYFCQVENVNYFDLSESVSGKYAEFYGQLAHKLNIVLVTSMFEKRAEGLYHNTAVVFERDGSIAGTYRKMHIPDDPNYYEKFYFTPGDLGFNPIKTSVGTLGVLVCWDQWYPEAARLMVLAGAQLLIYPTAIGWTSDDTQEEKMRQLDAWKIVQRGHAIANGVPVIVVNRTGNEPDLSLSTQGIEFWGNSFVSGPQGEILDTAPTNEACNLLVDIDLEKSEHVRRWWPFLRDRRIEFYQDLLKRYRD